MRINFRDKWIVFVIMFSLSVLFTVPLYLHVGYWGQFDWDQHFFYNAVPQKTILDFHEFPLWNPWQCGGNPVLANPQSMFLSPLFILVLLFGVVPGLKMSITVSLLIGLCGMFALARRFGLSVLSSYLAAFVFMLSSWYSLRMLAGHLTYFTVAFIPLVVLFYHKSLNHWKWLLVSGLLMAFIIFGGGVYPLIFTVVFLFFYGIFHSFQSKRITLLKNGGILTILFLLFGAVKLLPVYDLVSDLDLKKSSPQFYHNSIFSASLLSRQQNPFVVDEALHERYRQDERQFFVDRESGTVRWDWHEYGAYIGILPLVLAILSVRYWRRLWPLIMTGGVLGLFTLGWWPWLVVRKIPYLSVLHGHSRFVIPLVFVISLLAGYGFDSILKKKSYKNLIGVALLIVITADLFLVSVPIFRSVFVVPPFSPPGSGDFLHILSSNPTTKQYSNFLENIGTVNCYERIHLPTRVVPIALDNGTRVRQYRGNVYFSESADPVAIIGWTPNKITVRYNIATPQTLLFNSNYDTGWKSNIDVFSHQGLIAVTAPVAGEVRIRYLPTSFVVGLSISFVSVVGGAVLFRRYDIKTKKRSEKK